jgi:hypothetical protein
VKVQNDRNEVSLHYMITPKSKINLDIPLILTTIITLCLLPIIEELATRISENISWFLSNHENL